MLAIRPLVVTQGRTALVAAAAAAATAGLSVTFAEEKKKSSPSSSTSGSGQFPSVVKYSDISIWKKDDRMIYIQGARNYSQFSADLAARLVKDIKPQGVYVDITQEVLHMDFNIYERVQQVLRNRGILDDDTDLSQQEMMILREDGIENGHVLNPIPDYAGERRFYQRWYDSYITDLAVKKVFKHLMYAGNSPDAEKAESGEHYVQAIATGQELLSNGGNDCYIVLGGRDFYDGEARTKEAIEKTNRARASELPALIHEKWDTNASAHANFDIVRTLMKEQIPAFYQVNFIEAEEHIAAKLNKLDQCQSIVAVIMLIHVDGVEGNLKKMGWGPVPKGTEGTEGSSQQSKISWWRRLF